MRTPTTKKSLLRAMRLGNPNEFRSILVSEGWPADSDWSDHELLIHAVKYNYRKIADVLLDIGARLTTNREGVTTPLHLAAAKKTAGWTEIVGKLLAKGARVDLKNGRSETALHLAFSARASDEVIDMLLRAHVNGHGLNVCNNRQLGFVHIACTRSNVDVVRQFVEADKDILNSQVSLKCRSPIAGYTPLHCAVAHERLEVVEYILREGADMYKQDGNGSTALHLALELRNIAIIDLILRYDKEKQNRVNKSNASYLMAACAGSNEALVDTYLSAPSFTSEMLNSWVLGFAHTANSGYTPLHFAAEFGREHTVELLISKGANCCQRAANDVTPHALAQHRNDEAVARLLAERCPHHQCSTEEPNIVSDETQDSSQFEILREDDQRGKIILKLERIASGAWRVKPLDKPVGNDSSVEINVPVDDDLARLPHENLVAHCVADDHSNIQVENQAVADLDFDVLEAVFGSPEESSERQTTDRISMNADDSATFDVPLSLSQSYYFHDFSHQVSDLIALTHAYEVPQVNSVPFNSISNLTDSTVDSSYFSDFALEQSILNFTEHFAAPNFNLLQ